MANIDDLSKYNQENLLSILGYEKHSPTRNAGALKAEVKAYLAEYEFRGQKIPPLHRRNPAEARLCAYNFLEEDGRAERLFALNLDERLTWSADRATIVEAVAHLFRIRALNNHQNEIGAQQRVEKKICSHYATVETDCDGAESPSPSRKRARRSDVGKGSPAKRRREVESSPELDYQDVVALDAEYSLKPWAKASKRLNSQTAIHHIDSLNPAKRPDNIPEFTLDWLMDGLPWPVAADPELASFMHKWNFYVAENISSDVLHLGSYREVVDTLRSGTQLASLNGPRYQKFEKRVGERIEHLTGWFFKECFLENGIDGSLRKTKRFQELVDSRERVWKQEFETIASFENTLRRKKKVSRQPSALKSPVVFPNILHSPQQPNLRGDLREMADNVLEHLNKGLSVEEHDEYIVITPDLPAKVVLPEADPMEKYSATNTFFLDDSTASVPPKQPAPSPPRKLPVLAPAPPVTKMVVEELHHDEENLHRATKLHHCLTPESLRQVQSSISLARNHSHEVEEPSSVFGVTTEDPRKAVAATESPTITLAPEEEYAPKFAVKSDLLKACIAQGLKVLPGLNEAVQAELWRLHFWQHPDNISTFTLQSFCTKYQIPSIAKYTEWWTLQDEEQRTKRLQPNQRIPHAANAPSVTASDASTVHAYTFVASPPVAHEKHDQKFQALITGEQAAVKPVSPGSNAYHQSKGQTSFSSQWCTAKQNLQLKPSQSDNETRKNKHDSAERLQESRSTNHRCPMSPTSMSPGSDGLSSPWGDGINITGLQSKVPPSNSPTSIAYPRRYFAPQFQAQKQAQARYQQHSQEHPQQPIYLRQFSQNGIHHPKHSPPAPTLSPLTPAATIKVLQSSAPNVNQISPIRTPSPVKKVPTPHQNLHSHGSPTQQTSILNASSPPLLTSQAQAQTHAEQSSTILNSPTPSVRNPTSTPTRGNSISLPTNTTTTSTNTKTLDIIFQLASKDYDFENPVPFNALTSLSVSDFFTLYAEKVGLDIDAVGKVTLSLAFGNRQSFTIEKSVDGANGKWEKVKGRLRNMWVQQTKREPEKEDFEIWVEIES